MEGLAPSVAAAVRSSAERIVITGAGGWIGMATLELLHAALGDEFANRVYCFGSRNRSLQLLGGTMIEQHPLPAIANLASAPTIVLHLAFLTKDRAEAMDENSYRAANRALDQNLLDALEPIGTNALFVASSGAAARASDPRASPAMKLYGGLKQEQEVMFSAWAEQRGKRAIIARIFNISGPHINKQASYALAAFIRDALAGGPIIIRSATPVIRSYVAVRELMSLVFALLLDGRIGTTCFDSGGEVIEMQTIAKTVAEQLGGAPIERPPLQSINADHYVGNDKAYRALLLKHRIEPVSFARQVAETIDFLSLFRAPSQAGRVAMERRSW